LVFRHFVSYICCVLLSQKKESINGEKIEKHMKEAYEIECDGDKCVIKPKYNKCDDKIVV